MAKEVDWSEERRHCNRMIAAIFFGSLSSMAIVIEFLGKVPDGGVLAFFLLLGSLVWIIMYAVRREKARKNGSALDRSDILSPSFIKVLAFPFFYVIIAILSFRMI